MQTAQPQQRTSSIDDLEAAILQRGRELEAAEPRRSPWRTIDDAVTRRVSARPRMRSAFYRMVDVAPVCRSLSRPRGALRRLPAARRRSPRTRRSPGSPRSGSFSRSPTGSRAAFHRRLLAGAGAAVHRGPLGARHRCHARPARRGRRPLRGGGRLRGPLHRRARGPRPAAAAGGGAAARRDAARQPLGQAVGADRRDPAMGTVVGDRRRGEPGSARSSARRRRSAPTSTSTWSRSTRARRRSSCSARSSPRTSSAPARRSASSCRPTSATRSRSPT